MSETKLTKMVTKRDGTKQEFQIAKLQKRVDALLTGLETDHMGIQGCINKVVKYAHTGKYTNHRNNQQYRH